MTSTEYDYLNAIIPIICFLVPAYELILKKTKEKGLKKISNTGWVLLIIAILWGTVSFFSIKQTKAEKKDESHIFDSTRIADKKEIIDSIKKERGADTTIIIHDKKTIVYSRDSLNYYGVPLVEIDNFSFNYNPSRDSILITLAFVNNSNTDAYYFDWSYYYIYKVNTNYKISRKSRFYNNEIISNKHGLNIWLNTIPFPYKDNCDSFYLYINLTYSNFYKKNTQHYDKLIEWDFENNTWGFSPPDVKIFITNKIKNTFGSL